MPTKSQTAIKILTQYKRLAKEYDLNLSAEKIQSLNRLRDDGLIKISDLPAKLRRVFPGEFGDMTLNEIKAYKE